MKRSLCFIALLACLSFSVLAAPITLDGRVGPVEYNDTLAVLQLQKNESNNNLTYAYLRWASSPADYSIYLGLQYYCSDHAIENGMTGVEVRVNDDLVGTIFADGTVEGLDPDRYSMEGVFVVVDKIPYEVVCEIRVGVKFGLDHDIVAGVRILDFSGEPSNYYRQLVYSPYTTTTKAEKTTRTTTTQKSAASASTETVTQTTARTARTTAPVITASPKREPTATTAAAAAAQTTETKTEAVTTHAQKTAKPKTTKAKTTKRAKTTTQKAAEKTTVPAAAKAVPATTEPPASAAASAATNAQMYSEMNKVKIVGTVIAAVLVTIALMTSAVLGIRQKEKPEPARTAKEEYDDFG